MPFRLSALLLLTLVQIGCAERGVGTAAVRVVAAPPRAIHPDMTLGSGSRRVRLLVEPRDGVTPLIKAINKARETVFVAAYILSHTRIVHALDRAEARGVGVYVELEPAPYGIVDQPQRMMILLRAAGIFVRWRPAGFRYAHSKFIVIDDKLLILSSANFSLAGFTSDRDFVVLDGEQADVRESSNVFRADWDRIGPTLTDSNLLVSPANSRSKLSALVDRAKRTVEIYAEEVMDMPMVSAARDPGQAWGARSNHRGHYVRSGEGGVKSGRHRVENLQRRSQAFLRARQGVHCRRQDRVRRLRESFGNVA